MAGAEVGVLLPLHPLLEAMVVWWRWWRPGGGGDFYNGYASALKTRSR